MLSNPPGGIVVTRFEDVEEGVCKSEGSQADRRVVAAA